MSQIAQDLRYTQNHEWARVLDSGEVEVGISDHAQDLMGDMVYVELPALGTSVEAGKECAVVESVKAASDVYSPVSGEITAVNETLADMPEQVNHAPYGAGWLFRVRPVDSTQVEQLLDATAYDTLLEADPG